MANIDTTQSALPAGTVLMGGNASYTLLKTLGQGSFGITYLAKNIVGEDEVEQLFCIKEFFMRDINGRENTSVTSSNREGMFDYYKRKFEQESDHLSRLRHKNIVMVVDAFRANSTSYYVMQYIDGQSLDSLIAAKGRLSTDETVGITRQVGSALSCMHSMGMLHLDVKPANVMMADEKTAILIDFGLSKQYDQNGQPESSTTVGSGTPGYAPIEQANHREGKDFPVQMDVYALGATMLKMLTGQRPPEASDILNFGFPKKEMKQEGVPQPIIDVVEKAMKPQRSHRFQTMEQMMTALDEAMDKVKENEEKQTRRAESEATTVDSGSNKGKGKSHDSSKKSKHVKQWKRNKHCTLNRRQQRLLNHIQMGMGVRYCLSNKQYYRFSTSRERILRRGNCFKLGVSARVVGDSDSMVRSIYRSHNFQLLASAQTMGMENRKREKRRQPKDVGIVHCCKFHHVFYFSL